MIQEGDRLVLLEAETGRRWLADAIPGAVKEKGLGVYDPAKLLGLAWGSTVEVAGKRLVVLRPDLADLLGTLRRNAQVILPKDAGRIVLELGIGPGDRVFESGVGSGASTIALAWAVAPGGEVVVQELREDFRKWAMGNIRRAGLDDHVDVHLGDLTQGLADGIQGPFQAALLDQPEPWLAIPHLVPVLGVGARVVCYCPQVSQMEQAYRAMQDAGFVDLRCIETIERTWEVKERGSRPSSEGIGHTAFLVFGRYVPPS